jgi:hypothetical protein
VVAVSGVLIFAGYQLLVYGLDQVRGGNNGFVDLLWPGRFKNVMPDTPSSRTQSPADIARSKGAPSWMGPFGDPNSLKDAIAPTKAGG